MLFSFLLLWLSFVGAVVAAAVVVPFLVAPFWDPLAFARGSVLDPLSLLACASCPVFACLIVCWLVLPLLHACIEPWVCLCVSWLFFVCRCCCGCFTCLRVVFPAWSWICDMYVSPCLLQPRWWKELYNDRNVSRDHGGFRGAEQLYVPAHRMRLNDREHFVENKIVEGSNNIAAPSQETRQMLSKHLQRQDVSFADAHFGMNENQRGDVKTGAAGAKRQPTEASDPEYDTPKKEKAVVLDRERPALHRQMESGINKLRTDLNKSLQLTEVTAEKYRQHPPDLLASDRAAVAYMRTFQWRLEAAARVAGDLNDIKILVPEKVPKSESEPGQAAPPTPGSAMTGHSQIEVTDLIAMKKKMHFVDFLKTERVKESQFWPGEADDLLPISRLRELQEDVLNATDAKSFIEMKQQWQKAEKAIQGVAKGLKQSSDDVIKHLKSTIAARDRAAKRKQTQEERDALHKVKQEAAEAAAEIKKRRVQAPAAEPLFTADIAANTVTEKSEGEVKKMSDADWRYPWVIKASEGLKLCMGEKTLQNTLASWGAQYKRTLAQTKTPCVTYPLEEKQGKECFLEAMALWVDKGLVDLSSSSVAGGGSFHKSVWMYGCSNDMKTLAHLPNWACMLKVLASGEVRHVLFELDSTLKALYDMKKITDLDNINAALEALKALDTDSVKDLLAKKAVVRQINLLKNEVLYIPLGWLCLEVVKQSVHVYGIRKSFFLSFQAAAYEQAIKMTKAQGRDVQRMEQIHKLMQELQSSLQS